MSQRALNDEDLFAILERVAEGEFLRDACRQVGVHYTTAWRRFAKDPEWSRRLDMAKEAFGDSRAAMLTEFVRGEPDPKRADVIAKQERWIIENLARKNWGQHKRIEVSGPGGGPIELQGRSESELASMLSRKMKQIGANSVQDLLAMAERAAPKRLPQVIEGEVESGATPKE